MDKVAAKQRAIELHCSGFHCAEAVLVAVCESAGAAFTQAIPRVATCFGGGVGGCRGEICGALAGGLMAIGCLCGRDRQGQNWDCAAEAAVTLRQQFLELYGSTCCSSILAAMGPQSNNHRCKQLSGTTAEFTCQILHRYVDPKTVTPSFEASG